MACPPQDITDTELSILRLLWDRGSLTTRTITRILYPRGAASHYATVQSLLARLEEKSLVRRDRGERVHVFSAAVGRGDVIGRRLRSLADKLCGGALSPLLTHLVEAERLTPKERKELRDCLDRLERGKAAKGSNPSRQDR